MATLTLSSPWVTYYRELENLFEGDPEIRVIFDEEKNEIMLYVDNAKKAGALNEMLPEKKVFGNVELTITLIPANGMTEPKGSLARAALEGNPALSYIREVKGVFTNDITYVVFRNVVVQYYNDDLGDVNGLCSTLYQDIAKRVFGETEGVFFCTDVPGNDGGSLGTPLGEWP